jgi:hypothetical protein
MTMMQKIRNNVAGVGAGALALVAGTSHAAVDTGFQSAIDALSADVLLYIAAVTTLGLGILTVALTWDIGFSLVKKYTKKGAK